MAFVPGARVGKYVLGRRLGQGGFGEVFAAHDASLDREVALKFLKHEHTGTPEIVKRFLQEARSAAKIVHPGIVTVYECGQLEDGTAYIAMELLEGEALDARLARSGRLAPENALEIGRQLASALDAAHRAGIVHRDLKPENVFLVRDAAVGSGERAKVLDFGIAKLGDTTSSSVQTQSSIVFGTPRYMSPEQCRSAASVDHRSDVYTLGCILFELVCGRPPFLGGSGELIAQHILVEPPTVHSVVPEVPTAFAALIEQMLRKEPGDRPQTMAHVQRGLETSGAVAPGVAVTLPPVDPRWAPTMLPGGRAGNDTVRDVPRFGAGSPTTLSAFAGASVVRRTERMSGRTKLAVVAMAAAVAIAIPISYFGFRGGPAALTEPRAAAPRSVEPPHQPPVRVEPAKPAVAAPVVPESPPAVTRSPTKAVKHGGSRRAAPELAKTEPVQSEPIKPEPVKAGPEPARDPARDATIPRDTKPRDRDATIPRDTNPRDTGRRDTNPRDTKPRDTRDGTINPFSRPKP